MFQWTPQALVTLQREWGKGTSASNIANRLGGGLTKSAVIGKARRLGLKPRPSPLGKKQVEPELPEPKFKTREQWMLAFVEKARPHFERVNAAIPARVRVAIGFPSKGVRSKTIGECWSDCSSKDGICEIFIRPSLQSDASRIADVLTHELVHAAVGHEAKHGKAFRVPAMALGLEGKMTATTAGEGWHEWADPILAKLGTFPGAELRGQLAGGKKPQKNRQLKLTCDNCGWMCRTPQKQIDRLGDEPLCPCCGEGTLVRED